MLDYLPQEILIDILLRLPIKSIVQCTCLCKSYYSLITNPTFISTHLNYTSHKNSDLLLIRSWATKYKEETYSLRFDIETLDEYRKLQPPVESKFNPFFKIVGSCNGLVCLLDYSTIILWNPSINKVISLPDTALNYVNIGFGFDSKTNDHKVVRILNPHCWGESGVASPEVDVYSLCMRSWRRITAPPPQCYIIGSQAFINGAVHWVAFDDMRKRLILVFDISDEVFREPMLLPEILSLHNYEVHTCIGVFKGSLSIFQYGSYEFLCSIWVMKEYGAANSWTKQLIIDVQSGGYGKFLSVRKNGELILVNHEKLYSYDPESHESKIVKICNGRSCSFYVDVHMESLVLLNHAN